MNTTALNDLAYALHDSCRRFTPCTPRQTEVWNLDGFTMFQQTWGDTSLGFGGMGGQAITEANTVVVLHLAEACVYFGGRFAYKVSNSPALRADIAKQDMAPVSKAAARYMQGLSV